METFFKRTVFYGKLFKSSNIRARAPTKNYEIDRRNQSDSSSVEKVSSWQESCSHGLRIVATDRRANVSCEKGNQKDEISRESKISSKTRGKWFASRDIWSCVRLSEWSISINYCQVRCMLIVCARSCKKVRRVSLEIAKRIKRAWDVQRA